MCADENEISFEGIVENHNSNSNCQNKNYNANKFMINKNICSGNLGKKSVKGFQVNGELQRKRFRCFYTNARSMVSIGKKTELEMYVKSIDPIIIGLTETWTKNEIDDRELYLDGYVMFRKDRENQSVKGHGAGGVILYVKDEMYAIERKDIHDDKFKESIWCEIRLGKEKILIGVCYRVPDANEEANNGLFTIINKVSKENVVIMGDFNYHINWENMAAERIQDERFLNCINNNFLTQHILEPTRGKNILDLVITSDEHLVDTVNVGQNFGTSDHQIITFDLKLTGNMENTQGQDKKNFFKGDYDQARKMIATMDLEGMIRGKDADVSWKVFTECMSRVVESTIPKQKKISRKLPWVTREVKKKRGAKNKAWKKLRKHRKTMNESNTEEQERLQQLQATYVTKRNISAAANRAAIADYENRLAKNIKQDSKSFFSYMNRKSKRKDKIGPLIDESGQVITDEIETAKVLNTYFGSVFTKEITSNVPIPVKAFKEKEEDMLTDIVCTKEGVLEILSQLKTDKSPGIDSLHPKFLYEVRYEVSDVLSKIFNKSIMTGVVPRDWRDALVTPLFKKGNRSDPGNYRPVSLTCILGKVLEKIFKAKVMEHLTRYKILKDSQHGFLKGRSCLTNILDFLEEVYEKLDEGKAVDVIYLDFAKAFDKVPHSRLAAKLESCGIGGRVLGWIKNWLMNRRQKVGVKGKFSNWAEVLSGVPQGSVLGPLLFLVYINDIDEGILSKISKFADDTKLCREIGNDLDAKILQEDLKRLSQWSEDWQMLFNTEKCSVMHIGKKNKNHKYELGGKELKITTEERDLGVIMHYSLKPSRQCAEAAKKGNRILGLMKRTIVSRDKDIITRLYKTLVRPHLEYCVQAWNPFLKKDIEILERVQRRATKMIKGCQKLSYEDRLKRCGLTTLEKRRERGDLIETYKLMTGKVEMPHERFFKMAEHTGTRGHAKKLFKKRVGTHKRHFLALE